MSQKNVPQNDLPQRNMSQPDILEKNSPDEDLQISSQFSQKKKGVIFLEPEYDSDDVSRIMVSERPTINDNDNDNIDNRLYKGDISGNIDNKLNVNRISHVRPSTGNVRTKINGNINQETPTQGAKTDFHLSKNSKYDLKFENTFENDQNKEKQKKNVVDFYDEKNNNINYNNNNNDNNNNNINDNIDKINNNKNNNDNNNNDNDNSNDNINIKSSGNLKKKPLQPFWESIRIEKEKQTKELRKLKYWDAMKTPLVDRVRTPEEEEFSKSFEHMSVENGRLACCVLCRVVPYFVLCCCVLCCVYFVLLCIEFF